MWGTSSRSGYAITMQVARIWLWDRVFPRRWRGCRRPCRSSGIDCRHIAVWWCVRSWVACSMTIGWKTTSHDPNPSIVAAEREGEDAQRVILAPLVWGEKCKFLYRYDFGDSWDHELLVEKILPQDEGK